MARPGRSIEALRPTCRGSYLRIHIDSERPTRVLEKSEPKAYTFLGWNVGRRLSRNRNLDALGDVTQGAAHLRAECSFCCREKALLGVEPCREQGTFGVVRTKACPESCPNRRDLTRRSLRALSHSATMNDGLRDGSGDAGRAPSWESRPVGPHDAAPSSSPGLVRKRSLVVSHSRPQNAQIPRGFNSVSRSVAPIPPVGRPRAI
jgi:hypothetical protein